MVCYVGIDVLLRERVAPELFWKSRGVRIDKNLQMFTRSSKIYKEELTFEKAVEMFVENWMKTELNSFILVPKVPGLVSVMQLQDC